MLEGNIVEDLLDVSIALSSERDLEKLLDLILKEARRITHADAGTLYLVTKDGRLEFMLSQVQTLFRRWGEKATRDRFHSFTMDISKKSIAGYVALTGETLNIDDVRKIPEDSSFSYNPAFDEKNDYQTVSMLVVPIHKRDGTISGVLQIINALDSEGQVISFDKSHEKLALSLASQAGVAIQNARLNKDLHSAQVETILRLGYAAEYRDKETSNHIKRMSKYSAVIANDLNFSGERVSDILFATPMHDVGKLGIPDSILLKPGKLTEDERKVMNEHTIIGGLILSGSDSKLLQLSKKIAMTHHERWNGEGYPNGLRGEEIPIEGRITAVADVFDALSSKRVYKDAWPLEKVTKYMKDERNRQFDGELVDILLRNMPIIEQIRENHNDGDEDFDKLRGLQDIDKRKLLFENENVMNYDTDNYAI